MKRLGVIANCGKKRAPDVLEQIADKARTAGLELLADERTAQFLKTAAPVSLQDLIARVEAIMALGGDGTMLRVVRALDGKDKPVIGVNIGGLGFLTSVAEGELDAAMKCLASDDFVVNAMTVAEGVVLRDGKERARYRALNDIVLRTGPSSRIVTLEVAVDKDIVTSYACDGLIVSTPAGSTGHSLSAGGPILMPETPAFVLSLICPHTLSSRPLVVPDTSEISVTARKDAGGILLSVDGQVGEELTRGDIVKVRRSANDAKFIHLPGHSYFAVLRQKLHWSGSNV